MIHTLFQYSRVMGRSVLDRMKIGDVLFIRWEYYYINDAEISVLDEIQSDYRFALYKIGTRYGWYVKAIKILN